MIALTLDPPIAKSQLAASCDVSVSIQCERCKLGDISPHDNLRDAAKDFYGEGWRPDKDGSPYCPDCAKESQ